MGSGSYRPPFIRASSMVAGIVAGRVGVLARERVSGSRPGNAGRAAPRHPLATRAESRADSGSLLCVRVGWGCITRCLLYGGWVIAIRLGVGELEAVVLAAGRRGLSPGRFVKVVALEAAGFVVSEAGLPVVGRGGPGRVRQPRASSGKRGRPRKGSAGGSVRVSGGRPPSPAADPVVVGPGPPVGGAVAVLLVDVVAGRLGSRSLALRAIRLGQVRVGGVVFRDGGTSVLAGDVRVDG